ncbi:MAG TPA: hypothetical protein PK431_16660 [Chitinophagales bacterium]|nr:hypothetical protein [Chitinophagales bacterium]
MAKENPIIGTYKGVSYRHCNRIVLKFGIAAFKKIIDEVDKTGLSIQKVITYSGKPCDKCKDVEVTIFDKEDNLIKVKRGILPMPETNGINIITQYNNKKIKEENERLRNLHNEVGE